VTEVGSTYLSCCGLRLPLALIGLGPGVELEPQIFSTVRLPLFSLLTYFPRIPKIKGCTTAGFIAMLARPPPQLSLDRDLPDCRFAMKVGMRDWRVPSENLIYDNSIHCPPPGLSAFRPHARIRDRFHNEFCCLTGSRTAAKPSLKEASAITMP
jgi:hypothetical protein